jgi:outer membrane protein assembly factor BamD (BamD/ComL family)
MLFEQASRARVRGDYATALARYRRLQQQYPATRETGVSYVVMGRMQLDRGDAASALDTFDRYRASGDRDLDSLVMAGRALALDEVGSEGSSGAWAALLASHPDTPYAEHARLRVAAWSLSL